MVSVCPGLQDSDQLFNASIEPICLIFNPLNPAGTYVLHDSKGLWPVGFKELGDMRRN